MSNNKNSKGTLAIKGTDLSRVLANIGLWVESDDQDVLLMFGQEFLMVITGDGFTMVADIAIHSKEPNLAADETLSFALDATEMKNLHQLAKDARTKNLHFELYADSVAVSRDEQVNEDVLVFGVSAEVPPSIMNFIWTVANPLANNIMERAAFAMRPERFDKFHRVRADKEAPIDFLFVKPWNDRTHVCCLIKVGATFRAAVNLVNRDVARENLGEKAKEFLW